MERIARHIQYLVSRNDCVIIPGVGAILSTLSHSNIDGDGNILPPTRAFTFNPALTHNDGVLACSVARAEKISYEAAMSIIGQELAALRSQLASCGEYPLGQLGYLCMENDAIILRTYQEDNISVSTLWLPKVEKRCVREEKYPQKVVPKVHVRPHSRFREFIKAAAVIIAVLGFYCLVSTPIAVDDTVYASLSPDVHKMEASSLLPEQVDDRDTDPVIYAAEVDAPGYGIEQDMKSDSLIMVLPGCVDDEDTVTATVAVSESDNMGNEYVPIDEGGEYHVVVASLATIYDARDFIAMHKRDDLKILESGGRYRIYTTSHPTSAKAVKALDAVKDTYPSAWVCRK